MRWLLAVAVLVTAAGCKREVFPEVGDSCTAGGYRCYDQTRALECRSGAWFALPCRGPNGCKDDGASVSCDLDGSQVGDLCASSAEGKGLCAGNGTAVLECRQGTFKVTQTCGSCAVEDNQVVCRP